MLSSYECVDLKFNILWFLTAVAYWLGLAPPYSSCTKTPSLRAA